MSAATRPPTPIEQGPANVQRGPDLPCLAYLVETNSYGFLYVGMSKCLDCCAPQRSLPGPAPSLPFFGMQLRDPFNPKVDCCWRRFFRDVSNVTSNELSLNATGCRCSSAKAHDTAMAGARPRSDGLNTIAHDFRDPDRLSSMTFKMPVCRPARRIWPSISTATQFPIDGRQSREAGECSTDILEYMDRDAIGHERAAGNPQVLPGTERTPRTVFRQRQSFGPSHCMADATSQGKPDSKYMSCPFLRRILFCARTKSCSFSFQASASLQLP